MERVFKRGIVYLLILALTLTTGCGRGTATQVPGGSAVPARREVGEEPLETTVSGSAETQGDDRDYRYVYQWFCRRSMYEMLSEKWGDNPQDAAVIYSPVNLYLCLAMLSEMSDGETREQIKKNLLGDFFSVCADVPGSTSEEELAEILREEEQKHIRQCSSLLYENTLSEKCTLGNSLWLNEGLSIQKKLLTTIQRRYRTVCESGIMGSDRFDQKIQRWLNEQTGGKLDDLIVKDIQTSGSTMLLMLSAINFEDQWDSIFFDKESTTKDTFYGQRQYTCGNTTEEEKVDEVTCDFMHASIDAMGADTEKYQAVSLPLCENKLCIILPKEGVSVEKILKSKKAKDLLALCDSSNKKWEYKRIDFSMPKLDITSKFDLKPMLQSLGVMDAFTGDRADFTSLTGDRDQEEYAPVYLSDAHQTSRMMVDEKGCSVASYTEIVAKDAACLVEDVMELHCDRPFLFMVTNAEDLPLFIGVVNRIENQGSE